MTVASLRAGISRFEESDFINKDRNPMTVAQIPVPSIEVYSDKLFENRNITPREARLLCIADIALQDIIDLFSDIGPVTAFIAGPESLPNMNSTGISDLFFDNLELQTGIIFNKKESVLFQTGRAGGFQATDTAIKYLHHCQCDYVLVGGIDSYCNDDVLDHFDRDDRINSEDISDGFVASEAAGFMLLTSRRELSHQKYSRLGLNVPGIACEEGHRYSDLPYKGDGLAEAFRCAIANAKVEKVSRIYSSLNGENFGAKEYGVACVRNKDTLSDSLQLYHPADCFGDIGAAFGIVLICIAAEHMVVNVESDASLVYSSSERGLRGAVCISAV